MDLMGAHSLRRGSSYQFDDDFIPGKRLSFSLNRSRQRLGIRVTTSSDGFVMHWFLCPKNPSKIVVTRTQTSWPIFHNEKLEKLSLIPLCPETESAVLVPLRICSLPVSSCFLSLSPYLSYPCPPLTSPVSPCEGRARAKQWPNLALSSPPVACVQFISSG